ncbi:MAG: TGF-beta receptor type extracellular region [Verrucomicrobia bacterium]|nr:TGF-beta receptor type extracellular region [Verrucomicrobiota bacterium]
MPEKKFLTVPLKTDKMPPGIPYIVGNEAAERFNFYGMRAVLFVFMTKYLVDGAGQPAPMTENEANQWYHLFLSANYFFPTIGAIVSDAFWGKYRTIFWLSLVYCLGSVVLALDHTRTGLTLGLTLIAIGAGGIKPCVSSHVGDQFGPKNQHLLARAFGWFYFSVNAGSSLSIYLIPLLLAKYGAGPAFGLPAVLMLVATLVFWSGRYKFAHIPPAGRTFFRDTFTPEGWRALGRLALIFMFMIAFWALWDQSGSEWTAQAEKMNLHFLGHDWLPSQIQVVNAVLTVTFIPVFQYFIYPFVDRFWKLTSLRKIGLGIFIIGLSFFISAWIESQLVAGVKLSIGWQLPAYALLTAGEVLASITALEFAYTQAPRPMKSIVQALYLLSVSLGNLFAGAMHWIIAKPDGTAKLTGAAYYNFYALFSIGASIIFVFFALRYRGKTYLQGEQTA